jgi:hypothetical protein
VTIIGPVHGLVRQEARRRPARRGEVNELSALEANCSVAAGNDHEKNEDGPNE